jgi:hypothetical protein
VNQRWRDRRESYRPAGEPIDTRAYEIAAIDDDNPAKAFVVGHHYSATYPAARFRFGLYRGGALTGVAVFSQPCTNAVLSSVFPSIPTKDAVELGRFVLLNDVAGNGESWFIARCFELLRKEIAGVVSYSDPCTRTTITGHVVHPGHVGTIYQATNGFYRGRSKARTLLVLPDGTVLSERAVQKIRHRERGWKHAAKVLARHGADELGELEDSRAWLTRWVPALCRKLKHPGNHRYAWGLDRALRRTLEHLGPYPKLHQQPTV